MADEWTGTLVGKMHTHKITRKRLAQHMGLTQEYISMVLNGKKRPKSACARFTAALDSLIAADTQAEALAAGKVHDYAYVNVSIEERW